MESTERYQVPMSFVNVCYPSHTGSERYVPFFGLLFSLSLASLSDLSYLQEIQASPLCTHSACWPTLINIMFVFNLRCSKPKVRDRGASTVTPYQPCARTSTTTEVFVVAPPSRRSDPHPHLNFHHEALKLRLPAPFSACTGHQRRYGMGDLIAGDNRSGWG